MLASHHVNVSTIKASSVKGSLAMKSAAIKSSTIKGIATKKNLISLNHIKASAHKGFNIQGNYNNDHLDIGGGGTHHFQNGNSIDVNGNYSLQNNGHHVPNSQNFNLNSTYHGNNFDINGHATIGPHHKPEYGASINLHF